MRVVALIALLFSPLAAAPAHAITSMEYAKHFVDRRKVRTWAWRAALVAFLFFLVFPPVLIWLFLKS
ncbi:MAG TPA: hypothetical protein VMS75_12250 [Terriglobales bacterium]|nr:hypothetical protein [Terriglobales bacterium]